MAKKFRVITFGCQMNERDSEAIAGTLAGNGLEEAAEGERADIVVINSCSVRENADNKLYGLLGRFKGERDRPEVYVVGCTAQLKANREYMEEKFPFAKIIRRGDPLPENEGGLLRRSSFARGSDALYDDARDGGVSPAFRRVKHRAYITITEGCDNFCSYCIVPYARGRERSRSAESILREAKDCVAGGAKEITLLGQNVNSYPDFPSLLDKVSALGVPRIRYMTAHPKDLSDELIERHARLPNLMPSVHIPMQSGSTKILRKMNRHYAKEDYLTLVEKIRDAGARSAFADIAITTDIMVGFPGESEEDFAETLDAVRKARFDSAFTFIYSKRSGTKAAGFAGEIAPEVSGSRFKELLDALHPIMLEENEKRVGKTYSVLVDEESKKDSAFLTGKTEAGIPVNFKRGSEKIGDIQRVKITEAREFYLKGSEKTSG